MCIDYKEKDIDTEDTEDEKKYHLYSKELKTILDHGKWLCEVVGIAQDDKVYPLTTDQSISFDPLEGPVPMLIDGEKKEFWNNPNFVITRNDIANLKAVVDPFAY